MLFLQQLGLPVRLCSVILCCFIVHAKPEQSHGVFSLCLYLSNYLQAYDTMISIVTTVRMMVVLTVVILFFSLFCFKFPLFLYSVDWLTRCIFGVSSRFLEYCSRRLVSLNWKLMVLLISCGVWMCVFVMHLLQASEYNGRLWMSLSPVLRRLVLQLSHITHVHHTGRLVEVIQFFDNLDVAQLNSAFLCTDVNTLCHLMGPSCPPSTLMMMHVLSCFLIQQYSSSI